MITKPVTLAPAVIATPTVANSRIRARLAKPTPEKVGTASREGARGIADGVGVPARLGRGENLPGHSDPPVRS